MSETRPQPAPHHGRFVREGKLEREELAAELRRFLDLLLGGSRLELSYKIHLEKPADDLEHAELQVIFDGRDQELLLMHGAELLGALEYLTLRCVGLDPQLFDHVRFDSGNYRALRIEELKLSAQVAAQRVRETRQPFCFNPMSSRERRIIHLSLKDQAGVRTASEGMGEQRHLVVYPVAAK